MGPYTNGAGGRYRLTAILMHTGTSAHSGHYTARIMEQPPVGRDLEGVGDDGSAAATASAAMGGGGAAGGATASVDAELSSAALLDGARWWTFNDETVTLEDWKSMGVHAGVSLASSKAAKAGGEAGGGRAAKGKAKGAAKGGGGKRAKTAAGATAADPVDVEGDGPADGPGGGAADGAAEGAAEADAPPTGSRVFSSKTAYMLNYTLESKLLDEAAKGEPVSAPAAVCERIEGESRALRREVDEYAAKAAEQGTGRAKRDAWREELMPLLEGGVAPGDGRWISEEWLETALSLPPSKVGPIANGCLVCEHHGPNPQAVGLMRLVSSEAWRVLNTAFPGGGPELTERGIPHRSLSNPGRSECSHTCPYACHVHAMCMSYACHMHVHVHVYVWPWPLRVQLWCRYGSLALLPSLPSERPGAIHIHVYGIHM